MPEIANSTRSSIIFHIVLKTCSNCFAKLSKNHLKRSVWVLSPVDVPGFNFNTVTAHCKRGVPIRSFSSLHFPTFRTNAAKYGQEKLQIRTLFKQWWCLKLIRNKYVQNTKPKKTNIAAVFLVKKNTLAQVKMLLVAFKNGLWRFLAVIHAEPWNCLIFYHLSPG